MLRILAAAAVIVMHAGALPVSRMAVAIPMSHTLVVKAYEYGFQAPDSIAAGLVTVHLVDRGHRSHQLTIARLDDSSSLARVMKTLTDDKVRTSGITWVGGVESVKAGDSTETTLVLTPGRYVMLCAYDGDNGHTHLAMGMIRPLLVTATASSMPAVLPSEPVTIHLSDYHIRIDGALHRGRQLVRVQNDGPHRHHLNITRFVGKATTEDAMKWDGKSEPAPLEDVTGGAAAMAAGQATVIALDLTPGRYELACVLSDTSNAKPHYLLGMHDEITIK
jgi:uncharacterized cupredoxin-like copper-binding protein